MKLDDRNLLAGCYRTHGVRVVAVGFANVSVGVEAASLRRSDEEDMSVLFPYAIHEDFQVVGEVVPSTVAGAVLLLVIVAELHEDVVAGAHRGQNLLEAMLAEE